MSGSTSKTNVPAYFKPHQQYLFSESGFLDFPSSDYKFMNQCKKTYQFITQCKGVVCHPFKTAKITVFDPMKSKSLKVPLQDELLT